MSLMDTRFIGHSLHASEVDSYTGMINKHCNVTPLPNHCVNESGELKGFCFTANPQNFCAVLPLSPNLFDCICMFEIPSPDPGSKMNEVVLRLFNQKQEVETCLDDVINELATNEEEEASIDCLPEDQEITALQSALYSVKDARNWKPSIPSKLGLYHAYVKNIETAQREHKLFIIVRGGLPIVSEEIYNMWHDVKTTVSCDEFLKCEELFWARDAVIRNHSRVAAMVAQKLRFQVPLFQDFDLPGTSLNHHIKPTTVTFTNDIHYSSDRNLVECVNGACFTETSRNGILFDTLGVDGYWLFCGPSYHNHASTYGSEMRSTAPYCFSTESAHFASCDTTIIGKRATQKNKINVVLPNENCMQVFEKMGFNRNDDVIYLMDVVSKTLT